VRRYRGFAVAILATLALPVPSVAVARVPPGFFGVVPQRPLTAGAFDRMTGLGLTLRMPFFWYQIEPQPGKYDFAELDRVLGEAARTGVRVLPVLYGTPSWISSDPARPPLGRPSPLGAWKSFVLRLVLRYGPHGEFWAGRSQRQPVHRWQVWNEPNFVLFWSPRPSPRRYARLLRVTANVIRNADHGARIVAAGVAPIEGGMLPWEFLRRMYRVPGVRRDFDVAALHPYAASVRGVEYEVRQTRRVMARAGDGREPLQLTELGVASGGEYPNSFDRGPRGQARFVERVFARLVAERRRWRIGGVDWFSWQDGPEPDPHCVFCEFAGLFDSSGNPKPSWWSYRRAVTDSTGLRVR
jgi:hypothetical protein